MAYSQKISRILRQLRFNPKYKLFTKSRYSTSKSIRSKYQPVLSRLHLKYNLTGWQTRHFCSTSSSTPSTPSSTPSTPSTPKQKKSGLRGISDDIGHAVIDYSTIYKERTGVTSGLWRLRLNLTQEKEKVAQSNIDSGNLPVRAPLIEKAPWQSSIVVLYDFPNNPSILNEYIRFDGGVRFGRILEDMDSLAGNVAETHGDNDDGYPISFVTASVDRIDLKRRFPLNRTLVMQGTPIYVGRSSINVQISIFDKHDENIIICTANFIMVARDGITGTISLVIQCVHNVIFACFRCAFHHKHNMHVHNFGF